MDGKIDIRDYPELDQSKKNFLYECKNCGWGWIITFRNSENPYEVLIQDLLCHKCGTLAIIPRRV